AHVAQIEPSSALAHYNLAVGLHRRGLFQEAIVQYKEALKIDPTYPDAERFLEQAQAEARQSNTTLKNP
ncbi:MAG TPA: tetratricopeptide repeat protein, partial [Chthoniobacterales bacterium]|nr:tetratricopeptide repeat protein [Chthoniobacterales bacterium]